MIPFEDVALIEVQSTNIALSTFGTVINEWSFTDNIRYSLTACTVGIAPLRRSRLGGDGAYGEVTDTFTIVVMGGTAAEAVANFEELMRPLDQATRWARMEAVNVIQVRMRVRGGAEDLYAAVLGVEPGTPPAQIAPQWDESIRAFVIRGITLPIVRRGALLSVPDSEVAVPGTIGEIASFSFDATPALAPVDLSFMAANLPAFSSTAGSSGFVAVAPPGNLVLHNAADSLLAPGMTIVAEATARGGSVLRYTPTAPGLAFFTVGAFGLPFETRRCHLLLTVRSNSASADYLIAGRARNAIVPDTASSITTPYVRIPPGGVGVVSTIYLGEILLAGDAWSTYEFDVLIQVPILAGAASIDFGAILVVGDVGEQTSICAISTPKFDNAYTILNLNHQLLTQLSPEAVSRLTSGNGSIARSPVVTGDRVVQVGNVGPAAQMDACLFCDGFLDWRPQVGGTILTVANRARPRRAYRVPQ